MPRRKGERRGRRRGGGGGAGGGLAGGAKGMGPAEGRRRARRFDERSPRGRMRSATAQATPWAEGQADWEGGQRHPRPMAHWRLPHSERGVGNRFAPVCARAVHTEHRPTSPRHQLRITLFFWAPGPSSSAPLLSLADTVHGVTDGQLGSNTVNTGAGTCSGYDSGEAAYDCKNSANAITTTFEPGTQDFNVQSVFKPQVRRAPNAEERGRWHWGPAKLAIFRSLFCGEVP